MLKKLSNFKQYIRQQHLLWLGLIVLCVLLQWFDTITVLRYDRNLVLAGEWYRMLSGNFVHLNASHLLMNILGIALVLVFFATHLKTSQWLILIIFSSLFVSVSLQLFNPSVLRYVGLSGVLHGLFIAGAVIEIRRFPVSGWLLSAILVAKLVWEQLNGAMPGSESMIKGNVLVDSHLYGAISGLIFISLLILSRKIRS